MLEQVCKHAVFVSVSTGPGDDALFVIFKPLTSELVLFVALTLKLYSAGGVQSLYVQLAISFVISRIVLMRKRFGA